MKGSLCLFFLRQHYGPLGSVGCSLQRCRKQKLHRIAFHRGGGGGGGKEVRLKEWNVLIQPATCLVPFFKQTSRRLLELSIVMFLSNNELTVGRGLCPPQKKGRGPEVPPPYPSTPETMKRLLSLNQETLFSFICFLFHPFSFFSFCCHCR